MINSVAEAWALPSAVGGPVANRQPPSADSATARLAAARAAAVAAELRRLQRALVGAVGRDGWSGAAPGLSTLGWDAAGVLPLGNVFRAARTAQECRAIEQLPQDLRASRAVPGGLMSHEGPGRGHLLARHVRKSRRFLMARFKQQPYLTRSSSFRDRRTAEESSSWLLERNGTRINGWLRKPTAKLELEDDFGSYVGRSFAKDGTMVRTTKVRLVLVPENSILGYHIRTGHPSV